MFQSSEHTFVMPLDKWKTFQGDIDLPWDFSNGVMSVVWGRIRGFEAYGR